MAVKRIPKETVVPGDSTRREASAQEITMQVEKDQKVLDKLYFEIFQFNPAGQKVLADLSMRFYDRPSVVSGEPEHMTFVRAGERNVLLYIIQKCAEAQ